MQVARFEWVMCGNSLVFALLAVVLQLFLMGLMMIDGFLGVANLSVLVLWFICWGW